MLSHLSALKTSQTNYKRRFDVVSEKNSTFFKIPLANRSYLSLIHDQIGL